MRKKIWGNLSCLSITKVKAKTNRQIFICSRFSADGNYLSWTCNLKVLGQGPKIVSYQKWLGESTKGRLGPRSKVSQESFCTIRNLFCTSATPCCTGAKRFALFETKRLCAPSPNHFGELTSFGPCPRYFNITWKLTANISAEIVLLYILSSTSSCLDYIALKTPEGNTIRFKMITHWLQWFWH